MNKTQSTLTIGIPAYNEAKNIAGLLNSIYSQVYKSVKLTKVIVICDGCSDDTEKIVRLNQKKYPTLRLVSSSRRSGKAAVLNKLYDLASTTFLLTIDADVLFQCDQNIELMAQALIRDSKLNMQDRFIFPLVLKLFLQLQQTLRSFILGCSGQF
jgi:glycosyltransferase involved in cell wall biosynthesis